MVRPRPSLERQSGCIRIPFDSATFDKVLGDAATVVPRSSDKTRLADITCFKNTLLDSASLNKISALIKDKKFRAGTVIMAEDRNTEPALYLVRSGKCKVTSKGTHMDKTIMHDGFFGEDHMTMDVDKKVLSCIDVATLADLDDMFSSFSSFADFDDDDKSTIVAQYTVQAIEDTICGVLSLDDCRSVIDTTKIGQAPQESKKLDFKTVSKLDDLNRHQILGQGEFGQVWLVSVSNQTEIETPYALKIQPKYELTRGHQAKGAMREMEIMSELNHPFLLKSLRTFQDENLIYMLLEYIPGGELYSRVHTDKADGLPESEARFYGAGILEALSFLHRRKIVYRDLKPENVLLTSLARRDAHAKLAERLEAEGTLPDYMAAHVIYYAGPAKTPDGYASGSFGPTTAGRMDTYVPLFQERGYSMITLAKGNRAKGVTDSCKKNGGFYLGSVGGAAAVLAENAIKKQEVVEYEELGMEAVWRIEVEDFPAFIIVDDKGNDFFAEWKM